MMDLFSPIFWIVFGDVLSQTCELPAKVKYSPIGTCLNSIISPPLLSLPYKSMGIAELSETLWLSKKRLTLFPPTGKTHTVR